MHRNRLYRPSRAGFSPGMLEVTIGGPETPSEHCVEVRRDGVPRSRFVARDEQKFVLPVACVHMQGLDAEPPLCVKACSTGSGSLS